MQDRGCPPALKRARAVAVLIGLALALARPARAEEPIAPPASGAPPVPKWELELFGYGFFSALDLRARMDDVSVDKSVSFGTLWDNLKWALEGGAELRYERAILFVDVIGNQVRFSESEGARTRPFQLTPIGPGGALTAGPADGWFRTTLWIADFMAGLNAVTVPYHRIFAGLAPDDPRRVKLDIFAGARYWNVKNKLSLDVAPGTLRVGSTSIDLGSVDLPQFDLGDLRLPGRLLRGGSRSVEETVDWVDAIMAFRVSASITDTISAYALADCGGWGIGSSSQFTWQGVGGLRWQFSDHLGAVVAYRAIQVRRNDLIEKATLKGPMAGLVLRF